MENNKAESKEMSLDEISAGAQAGKKDAPKRSGPAAAAANSSSSSSGGASGGGGGGARPPSNRVYVGNLPWSVSWQDLKDHFRAVGEPVYSTVFIDDQGRSKGCGLVEFATKEEAQKAIAQLNDTTIGNTDRLIFVREDREERPPPRDSRVPRRGPPPSHSGGHSPPASGESVKGRQVFVGNLPWQMSWQDLKDHFRTAGNIVRADVLYLSNGKSKGQGTVLFETKAEAQKAIEMFDNTDVQGRRISVHEDKYAA